MSQSPKLQQDHSTAATLADKNNITDCTETNLQTQSQDQVTTSQTSFDGDEDNNPFLHHQGLSSFSRLHLNSSQQLKQQSNEDIKTLDDVDDSMLLYKTSKLDKSNKTPNHSIQSI